ncbi:MAG: thiamine-phosphate kinase [bacterium]
MNEREFIRLVARELGPKEPGLRLGDDAAHFKVRRGFRVVVSTDALIEGVHFSLRYSTLQEVGWRLVAVNMSDLAAMGATPLYFLMDVAFSRGVSDADLEQFVGGVGAACAHYGVQLIGGDTDGTPGVTSMAGVGIGACKKPVERGTARVGDTLVVTNSLGAAHCGWASLDAEVAGWDAMKNKHLRPVARVAEGAILAKSASAMIDISDGLSSDLTRLAEESGKGMLVRAANIPIHPDATRFCREREWNPLDIALKSGEEYELLAAVPPSSVEALARNITKVTGSNLTPVGQVISRKGVYLEETVEATTGGRKKKVRRPLPETGYQHSL